ncbi:hypothetical protein [Martelella soudanensis]|uniref:hypothetical protein n=1 Tax=unclassified Martelella TaxID=2629616 RepID=UPI0015DF972F|nr:MULTISPECIES: hypothetical protein [unclassified Martelella]
MKPAVRAIGTWLRHIRKSFNPRSEFLTAEKPLRASNIILAMTVAMVLLALVARLGAELFG